MSKNYAMMSVAERWAFHADIYAFRLVFLGQTDSPCDPERKWFDKRLVDEAVARKRNAERSDRTSTRDAWARSLGWNSFDEREDAIAAGKRRLLDGDWNHPERSRERANAPNFKTIAAALGVHATETKPR